MTSDGERALAAWGSGIHRSNASLRDGEVVKAAGAWAPAVISLLRHLERIGFRGAPRVAGDGFTADGRVRLTYVSGSSAHPKAWTAGACGAIGILLRQLHEATSAFRAASDAQWAPHWLREIGVDDGDLVVGHGDAAPWNIVGPETWPAALIDWDLAGPIPRLTELAFAVWLNAQLHDDDIAEMHGLPDAHTRAREARDLVDGYSLEQVRRVALVDRMIEVAVMSARADAIAYNVTPDTTSAVSAAGFPVLWSIAWRSRSAAWMLQNRRMLITALTK